jgi:hypothetical protein
MAQLTMKARFDAEKCRQYLNDEVTVFHCHHYTSLFTQLADDAKMFDGARHLRDAAAESMGPVLTRYCADNGIESANEKIDIAQQYFAYVGLGALSIDLAAGTAEMTHSHVDEGWVKKWGNREQPVNFIGQGFIAAACALANGDSPANYSVVETQSIVSGAPVSTFTITKK